jgi:hypothetical protein
MPAGDTQRAWFPEMLEDLTSLIRVNPEKATTEGEMAGRAVLGESGVSPPL